MTNRVEKTNEMKIFCSEDEINYNQSNNYAFLNWCFDDAMGGNDKSNPVQTINDNFEMGKAYMANAVLGLYSILYNRNRYCVADMLVFPILFDVWHGVELWLKSSINAIHFLIHSGEKLKNNHGIYEYLNILKCELSRLNMNKSIEIARSELSVLIEELKRVNAHFDFARYSFGRNGEYQFYNAPLGEEKQWQKKNVSERESIIPNTGVDLQVLFTILLGVVENFKDLVEYLTLVISEGGELSDEAYMEHLRICKEFEEHINQDSDDKEDMGIEKIMELIYSYIL